MYFFCKNYFVKCFITSLNYSKKYNYIFVICIINIFVIKPRLHNESL